MAENLYLKWGTAVSWHLESDASRAAMQAYIDEGTQMAAMTQSDTAAQRKALCDLIDIIDGPITNDWSGERMTKEQAKKYIMGYRS